MWVRIRLRNPATKQQQVVSGYANGGFRAGEPRIVLPKQLAELLGFNPQGGTLREGEACGGVRLALRELGEVEVKVEVPDRETPWVPAKAIFVEGEREVLMSRELMGALRIIPFYSQGKWRLEDDPPDILREEAAPQFFQTS